MTSDKQEQMISRVRAMLRQAEDPAATPEEAQAFAAKAAELMARHSLSEAVIRAEQGRQPEPVGRWDFTVSGHGANGKARVAAFAKIITAYGCTSAVVGNDASTRDRKILIIGTESALTALRVLLPAIGLQMEAAASRSTREQITRLGDWYTATEKARHRRDYYRSFVRAYGDAVATKIGAAREQIAEEAAGTGAELVLAGDAGRIKAEFVRQFPKLGKCRAEKTYSSAGYRAGYAQGRQADIATGHIAGTGQHAIR